MKRPWLILFGGLLLALLAYGTSYLTGSAKSRSMACSETPTLAWLKSEFHLSDAEYDRISKLHSSYQSACAERCRLIDAKNAELQNLLARTNAITADVEKAIHDAAELRADCQKAMLQHFYEVSRTMPLEQGKRYFNWIVGCTFGSEHDSMTHATHDADHEHHHE
jgi:hypothetical protein